MKTPGLLWLPVLIRPIAPKKFSIASLWILSFRGGSAKNIFVFDKNNFLIKKINLPIKEHVKGFDYIYYEGNDLTVFFSTNDTYAYKAVLDEDTFEISKWGFSK